MRKGIGLILKRHLDSEHRKSWTRLRLCCGAIKEAITLVMLRVSQDE